MAPGPRAGPIPVGQLGNPGGSLEGWNGETALGLAPLMCITCKGCLVADGMAGYRYTQCIMCHENKTYRNTISNSDRLHLFMTRTEIVEFWRCHGIVLAAIARGMCFDHLSIICLAKKGFVQLVKPADHARIVSNADVFDFELDPDRSHGIQFGSIRRMCASLFCWASRFESSKCYQQKTYCPTGICLTIRGCRNGVRGISVGHKIPCWDMLSG